MIEIEPPPPYFPLATLDQLKDRTSWINNSYPIPVDPYARFFVALGEGLAAWSIVESSLFDVASVAIKPQNGQALLVAYDNLTTFRTKLDFVSAAVYAAYDDGHASNEWTPLYNKLHKKSQKRNAMAHSPVFYDHNEPSEHRKFFIVAEVGRGPSGTRLFQSDLASLKQAFDRLSRKCFDFAHPPETPEESHEPERRRNHASKERGRPVFQIPPRP